MGSGPKTIPPYYDLAGCRDVFDVAAHCDLSMELGSAVKYLVWCGRKEGAATLDDLRKALTCVAREIERKHGKLVRYTIEDGPVRIRGRWGTLLDTFGPHPPDLCVNMNKYEYT